MGYNKYNIALLCTSAGYFYIWVVLALAVPSNTPEPVYFGIFAAPFLLLPLSLFGSFVFVVQNRKKSNKWFLGLPLLIVILALVSSMYFSGIFSVPLSSGGWVGLTPILKLHLPEELFFILLALVSPASALLIQSMPEEQRKSAKKYVKIAVAVSIYVAIIGFMYLLYILIFADEFLLSVMTLMFGIYVVFGLPSIGICLVLLAKGIQNESETSSFSLFGKL